MKNTTNDLALTWAGEAETDLDHILEYIGKRNPNAAHKILDTIEDKTSKLVQNPKIYRIGRVAGTREMLVTPSYLIIYKESSVEVKILRVLHTAQMWPE
jgi:addiction module RelE/StbE family toxin